MDDMEVFEWSQLSETVFVVKERDKYDENPQIYVIKSVSENKAYVIDSGCDSDDLLTFISRRLGPSIPIKDIILINTHSHYDHVAGNHRFSEIWASNQNQSYTLDSFNHFGWYIGCPIQKYKITRWLGDLERLEIGDGGKQYFQVVNSPGHTPDSICLYYPMDRRLFVGDFIYRHASILAISPFSSVRQFEQSAGRLVRFVEDEEKREHGGGDDDKIRLSCGHIDNQLESAYLLELHQLLKGVLSGDIANSNKWSDLFNQYFIPNSSLVLMTRKFAAFDRVLKPIVKLFVKH